jgi:lysophospholipase L1-like esterase
MGRAASDGKRRERKPSRGRARRQSDRWLRSGSGGRISGLAAKESGASGLPFQVVNAGVSGDTTSGGLRRLDWALRGGADVLIVALGGNDGLRGVPPKQTAANLQAIIQQARAKCPDCR